MRLLKDNGFYFLGATLLFTVLSSKHILIYNEELLILISFSFFMATCAHTLGNSFAESFQARRNSIEEELRKSSSNRYTFLQQVKKKNHVHAHLTSPILRLKGLTKKQIKIIGTRKKTVLQSGVQNKTSTQLTHMMGAQKAPQSSVLNTSSRTYLSGVKDVYQLKKNNMQRALTDNGVYETQKMQNTRTLQKKLTHLKHTDVKKHNKVAASLRIAAKKRDTQRHVV